MSASASSSTSPRKASTIIIGSLGTPNASTKSRKSLKSSVSSKARCLAAIGHKSDKRSSISHPETPHASQVSREYTMQGVVPGLLSAPPPQPIAETPQSKIMGSIIARRRMYSLTRKALNSRENLDQRVPSLKSITAAITKSVQSVSSEMKVTGALWQAAVERQIKRDMADLVSKMDSDMDTNRLLEELNAIKEKLYGMKDQAENIHVDLTGIDQQLAAIENYVKTMANVSDELSAAIVSVRAVLHSLLNGERKTQTVLDKIKSARLARKKMEQFRANLELQLLNIGKRPHLLPKNEDLVEKVVDFLFALPTEDRMELDRALFEFIDEDGGGKHAFLVKQAVEYSLAHLSPSQRSELSLEDVGMDELVEACQARAWRMQIRGGMDKLMQEETNKILALANLMDQVEAVLERTPTPPPEQIEATATPTLEPELPDLAPTAKSRDDVDDGMSSHQSQAELDAPISNEVIAEVDSIDKEASFQYKSLTPDEEKDGLRHTVSSPTRSLSKSEASTPSPVPEPVSPESQQRPWQTLKETSAGNEGARGENQSGRQSRSCQSPQAISSAVNDDSSQKVDLPIDEDRSSLIPVELEDVQQARNDHKDTQREDTLQAPLLLPRLDSPALSCKQIVRCSTPRACESRHREGFQWEPLEDIDRLNFQWQEMQLQRQRACGRTKDWLSNAKLSRTSRMVGSDRLPACLSSTSTGFRVKTPRTRPNSSATPRFPPLLILANELVGPSCAATATAAQSLMQHSPTVSSLYSTPSWDPGASTSSWSASKSLLAFRCGDVT